MPLLFQCANISCHTFINVFFIVTLLMRKLCVRSEPSPSISRRAQHYTLLLALLTTRSSVHGCQAEVCERGPVELAHIYVEV